MRLTLLLFSCLPVIISAQTSRVTTSAGDFYNPLIWSPIGLPTNGDSLQINHAVVLNLDVYYNAGQIKINPGGSLIEDGVQRNVWIDGGSLINNGTYTAHLVYVSNGGYLHNWANMTGIDSMMVQANFTNTGTAGINDFWVMQGGTVTNSGTLSNTDSMFVQGVFTNSGTAGVYDLAFDEMATLTNSGSLNVTHNMHNQGKLFNTYTIEVANDFSNCNTQNLNAVFTNDGIVCFGNDFLNCDFDTLRGSGDYFVSGLSSNLGIFAGTHAFHTPNGSLTLNTGFVQPTVTLTTGACSASLAEQNATAIFYPNPTNDFLYVSAIDMEVQIISPAGQLIMKLDSDGQGRIDLRAVPAGIYFVSTVGGLVQRIIKK